MGNDRDEPAFVPDVQSSNAIVRTPEEARASLARISGKPKDEEVYWCMGCGFVEDQNNPRSCKYPSGLTLKFDPEEIEALGGDLSQYTGPCPVCKAQLLVPKNQISGQSISAEAHQHQVKQWHDQAQVQAEVFADVIGKKVVGSVFDGGMMDPDLGGSDEGDVSGPGADLPDADEVDRSNMKPREG